MAGYGIGERAAGAPLRPLREVILSKDQLALRAEELAQYYTPIETGGRAVPLKQRFRENTVVLQNAYFAFSETSQRKEILVAGAEWLLDNFHIIDEQVRDIRRDLPRSYYRALPRIASGEWRGFPRVYRIMCDFIAHTDSVADTEALTTFVQAYQKHQILRIGELWAVPIMLRLGLVENLRRLAESGIRVSEQRRKVEQLCKEVIDASTAGGTELLMSLVNAVKAEPSILDQGAALIMRRLRSRGGPSALAVQWLDEQIRLKGLDPNDLERKEQQIQAADQISIGNCVTALKTVGSLNWRKWFEQVSHVDAILSRDPAKLYAASDFYTRDFCRHRIENAARRTRIPEAEVAEKVLALATKAEQLPGNAPPILASHVGYYLIDQGFSRLEEELGIYSSPLAKWNRWSRQNMLTLYLGAVASVVGLLVLNGAQASFTQGGGFILTLLLALFAVLPVSELAILVVQWFATKITPPRPMPKLDFEEGVPESARTAVVVQTIVADREQIERVIETMEIRAIGNFDPQLCFGVLADLPDANAEVLPGDLGIVNHGRQLIEQLNERYFPDAPPRFFIMFRRRQMNLSEGKYIAWERKRGKVTEFNRFLRGAEDTSFDVIDADVEFLRGCTFVLTLDNDTQLPPGTARKLIGTAAHPLNHPVYDSELGRVTRGYSIFQPRVGITLESANASLFSSVFSGSSGLDPYTRTVSDVYQDLFREGSYIGKGVYHVDCFEKALETKFPENALLSHDLIEGCFARCALVSDVEVYDDFPMRYHAQAKRQHRWIRGDWQLYPWVMDRIPDHNRAMVPTSINGLGRWKLFDNLRRSLVPVSTFVFVALLAGWAPGSQWDWLCRLFVVVGFPLYIQLWRLVGDIPIGFSISTFFKSLVEDLKRNLLLVGMQLAFLPHQAWISLSAIGVSVYRVRITKRNMLEWETALATEKRLGGTPYDFYRTMWPAMVITAVTLFAVLLHDSSRLVGWPGLMFLAWLGSPYLAYLSSKPTVRIEHRVSRSDRKYLRSIAFDTWKYFDKYLTAEYNYLIPDNLQTVPEKVVAERTSPTNISLSMMSVIAACDLGFIPLTGVVRRIERTFETLSRLERFHGHFLNWYAIRDLRPLLPRYISTVDSGNLVGHMIAVHTAFESYPFTDVMGAEHLNHLHDLIAQIEDLDPALEAPFVTVPQGEVTLKSFFELVEAIRALREALEDDDSVSDDLRRTLNEYEEIEPLIAWARFLPLLRKLGEKQLLPKRIIAVERILEARSATPSLLLKLVNRLIKVEEIIGGARLDEREREQFHELIVSLRESRARLGALEESMERTREMIRQIVRDTDFGFLFDKEKKLFVIGYNVDNGHRDNSYYDLLASEARLASFVAIAKGEISQTHWFLLNRTLTSTVGGKCLLSWSGTMFEYLMPVLVMRDYPSTLLGESYQAVVRAQRGYGQRRGVPWGISESAYSGVDFEKTYQYRAFGVPGLGLKRGLGSDLVISPYSTMMALTIDPLASVQNLRRLEADGTRGEYGFYEAVDFTPDRLGEHETFHVVKSFFAHHQGMSLISITNLLTGGLFRERFHSNPSIRASELLLQEKFPTRIPVIYPHQAEVQSIRGVGREVRAQLTEHLKSPHTRYPITRVLSNGDYTVVLDNAGGGWSSVEGEISLTRINDDPCLAGGGTSIYVRDRADGAFWSTAFLPTRVEPDEYEVFFNPDKVEYRRREKGLSVLTEVTVSPEDDVEVRRVTVTNVSDRLRPIELTSYGEVALAPRRADSAHPAFSKIFVSSEFLEEFDALLFTRRPRSPSDKQLYFFHLVTMAVVWAPVEYETSRERFIGRGRSLKSPIAMRDRSRLSGTVGTVLDPIFAMRQQLELEEGQSTSVSFVSGFAHSREEALALVRKYREESHIARAFEMAWSHSHIEIRHQQFSLGSMLDFQRLANAIFYNIETLRASTELMRKVTMPQSALWRFGISGDEPIVLLVITDSDQLKLAQEMLRAHEYLRLRGVRFDLVILNEYASGYLQDLQEELDFAVKSGFSRNLLDQRGGVFLRSFTQLSVDEINLLYSVARVIIHGSKGTLSQQLAFDRRVELEGGESREWSDLPVKKGAKAASNREMDNGIGGFVDNGKKYELTITPQSLPPAPWANVIANEQFGFLVTELGGGYSWCDNSRENRLSPWSNDPVLDPAGEVIYLRDEESGAFWTPTPQPFGSSSTTVRHGFGMSSFEASANGVDSLLTLSGSVDQPVKWWHLELTNRSESSRQIGIYLYFEWVLGVQRAETFRHIRTGYDPERQMVWASNPFNNDFGNQLVFLGTNLPLHSFTTNRREFLGRIRDLGSPGAFEAVVGTGRGQRTAGPRMSSVTLSGSTGGGFDSAAVLKVQREIRPGEKIHILFYMGKAGSIEEARERSARYRSLSMRQTELTKVDNYWDNLLGTVQVKTPDRKLDLMVNGWLLYQTVACRMFARSGFYQSSGAIGFRDQLQDSLALSVTRPDLTRRQILLHASRQYKEGDVQHWWHPPIGRGIRTRISDNYLWLPFAVDHYVTTTGDRSILDEVVSFLEGPQLEPEQHDLYHTPQVSAERGSLYEHCLRSLDRAVAAVGPHGLPLMGCGDWNDGMNEVGPKGKGESVWLGWFIPVVMDRFSAIVEQRGDAERAGKYRAHAAALLKAVEEHGWDGEWYRRAYFDDGTPLGTAQGTECRIDSLAQSWSVIYGKGDPKRAVQAVHSAHMHLVDSSMRILKLLTPAFVSMEPNPGYIRSYPAGIRENGGQYTHGSVWLIQATALLGEGEEAHRLFDYMNPISHGDSKETVRVYKTEPYVTCGDVYSSVEHPGRGGWSWYTGSSGWLYRIAVENIVGVRVEGSDLVLDPCVPGSWTEFSATVRRGDVIVECRFKNPEGKYRGVKSVTVDGKRIDGNRVPIPAGVSRVNIVAELG